MIDLPGTGTHSGAEELLAAYTTWAPRRPQRHLVLNTHVYEWHDTEAKATSDVVLLLLTKDGWSTQLVGRYHDQLVLGDDGKWRFTYRRAEFVTAD